MIDFLIHAYGQFTPIYLIGPAQWNHFDLIFIHHGEVTITMNHDEEVRLRDKQAILIYPQTHFQGASAVPVTDVSVQHFAITQAPSHLPWIFQQIAELHSGFRVFSPQRGQAAEAYIHRAMAFSRDNQSEPILAMRQAMLTLILCELHRIEPNGPMYHDRSARFGPLLDWLKNNIHRKVSIAQMAQAAGLSPSHFRCEFHRAVHCSAGQYFLELKMTEAARLLRETVRPIKVIAQAVGYYELPHFYRAFQARYHQSPLSYRRSNSLIG